MRTSITLCVQTGGGKAGFPLTRMEPSLSSTKQAPFFHCTIARLAAAHTFLMAEISRHALSDLRSHQGNQYPLECHRAHIWDLFFSWSLSTVYLPAYLFQPICMQMMLSFTSRHEKYRNRRAPYLTTLMTPSTDMPCNFKTPSLLLIYGHIHGMESLVLKTPRLFKLAYCYTVTPLPTCQLEIKSSLVTQSTNISVFCRGKAWIGLTTSMKSYPKVISKATRKAGLLCFMMHNLNDSLTIKLFFCYVWPTLQHASPLWHGTKSEDDAKAMERIQTAVARHILRAPWHTPKSALLALLNWPALRWKREIASLCLLHQLLNNRPEPLSTFLVPLSHRMLLTPKESPGDSFSVQHATHSTLFHSLFELR